MIVFLLALIGASTIICLASLGLMVVCEALDKCKSIRIN